MIEEDFYATVKLKTGEEIFAKVAASEEEDRTFLLLSNPITVCEVKNKIGIISEPGGAAPTAAFLSKSHDFYGKVVVVMVSGGNIDKTFFKKILNYD